MYVSLDRNTVTSTAIGVTTPAIRVIFSRWYGDAVIQHDDNLSRIKSLYLRAALSSACR